MKKLFNYLDGKKTTISALLMALLLVDPVRLFLGDWYEFVTNVVYILLGVGVIHKGQKSIINNKKKV